MMSVAVICAFLCASMISDAKVVNRPPKWNEDSTMEEIMASCEPECDMDACGLIRHQGFECEEHSVETSDGYILGLQRIKPKNPNAPAVLLQHGLLCSSSDWLNNLRDQALGYILADAGFDVWLGNARGNRYSKKHKYMDPKSTQFWQFSWYHMAKYDLPAMLNHVLKTSGKDKLYYVGHSQGTLQAFAGFPQNKALMSKIKMFFALGPLTTMQEVKGLLKYVAPLAGTISGILKLIGSGEFMGTSPIIKILGQTVCATFGIKALCGNVLFLIAGMDNLHFNQTRLPIYFSHTPAGTSSTNMVHFAQMIRSGKFQAYDFGSAMKNQIYYGQSTPPNYDISAMTAPVQLYWGGKDWLATPKNVRDMIAKLPNVDRNEYIGDYDHLDFIWAVNANTKVYYKIRDRILELEQNEPL